MATRHAAGRTGRAPTPSALAWRVNFTSVGGVDAAKRVEAGRGLRRGVALAADAIDKLQTAAACCRAARWTWWRSGVSVAVRAGAPAPDIGSEGRVARRRAGGIQRRLLHRTQRRAVVETVRALGHRRVLAGPVDPGPARGVPVAALGGAWRGGAGFPAVVRTDPRAGHHHRRAAAAGGGRSSPRVPPASAPHRPSPMRRARCWPTWPRPTRPTPNGAKAWTRPEPTYSQELRA